MTGEPLHLLIGGGGRVGTAVRARLQQLGCNYICTTREKKATPPAVYYDLDSNPRELPDDPAIVYLVAGIAGFVPTQDDRRYAWRVNVDGVLRVALRYRDTFRVYVSSDAVEYCGGTELARMKAQVEAVLLAQGNAAVVRPGRIPPERADDFARLLVSVGVNRSSGLFRWE